VIVLENSSVQLAEGGDSAYTFSIQFSGEGTRTYKLTADDDDTCMAWVKALSSCSYRQVKAYEHCLKCCSKQDELSFPLKMLLMWCERCPESEVS